MAQNSMPKVFVPFGFEANEKKQRRSMKKVLYF